MPDTPYHYIDSGLENIFLTNGFHVIPYGEAQAVSIDDLEGLHGAIAGDLCELARPLTGKEFRFLRVEMKMSPKRLGDCFGIREHTIRDYEKGNPIPKPVEGVLRNLYLENAGKNPLVKPFIQALNRIDRTSLQTDRSCLFYTHTDKWALQTGTP